MDDAAARARAQRRKGYLGLVGEAADPAAALAMLKQAGASPIDAIATLRARFGMSTADAKSALHVHPAWFAEARAAEALHDELEAHLDEILAAPRPCGRFARLRTWLQRPR